MRRPSAAVVLLCLLPLTGCQLGPQLSSCVSRDGSCFDARINGQDVVPLTSRSFLKAYEPGASASLRLALERTQWRLVETVHGDISVTALPNARGEGWFGDHATMEALALPLGHYEIAVTPELSQSETVRAGGRPVVTTRNVLAEKRLPPGDYVFILRLRGTTNWDRKHVFVQVK